MANDISHISTTKPLSGPHPQSGREKMRGPVIPDQAERSLARVRQSDRTSPWCATTSASLGARAREGDDIGYIRITTFNEQTTEG